MTMDPVRYAYLTLLMAKLRATRREDARAAADRIARILRASRGSFERLFEFAPRMSRWGIS